MSRSDQTPEQPTSPAPSPALVSALLAVGLVCAAVSFFFISATVPKLIVALIGFVLVVVGTVLRRKAPRA